MYYLITVCYSRVMEMKAFTEAMPIVKGGIDFA